MDATHTYPQLQPISSEMLRTLPHGFRSASHGMNHLGIIRQSSSTLWFQPHFEQQQVPIPLDAPHSIPKHVSVDGANLVVTLADGQIRYRKIVHEKWKGDPKSDGSYIGKSKVHKHNWKDRWCTHKLWGWPATMLFGRHIRLPDDLTTCHITHRGEFSRYLKGPSGERHRVVGCTTLDMFKRGDTKIRLMDPHLPHKAEVYLPLPRNNNMTFRGESEHVSGSHRIVIGYEERASKRGALDRQLACYTICADLDTLGWSPLETYSYRDEQDGSHYMLPHEDWKKHPLDLPKGVQLTDHCAIAQTDPHDGAPIMELEGKLSTGQTGYFRKALDEEQWIFVETGHEIAQERFLRWKCSDSTTSFIPITSNWKRVGRIGDRTGQFALKHFGLDSIRANAYLTVGDRTYSMLLYRRVNLIWASIFGKDPLRFDLVAQEDVPNTPLKAGQPIAVSAWIDQETGALRLRDRPFLTQVDLTLYSS